MLLDLIIKNSLLIPFLFGKIDIDAFISKYKLIDKYPNSYFFRDFKLSEDDIFELNIVNSDTVRKINLSSSNSLYFTEFRKMFVNSDMNLDIKHIYSREKSNIPSMKIIEHWLILNYEGNEINIRVINSWNFTTITLDYSPPIGIPKEIKLVNSGDNQLFSGILVINKHKENSFEMDISLEEWKQIMDEKYIYWDEEYFIQKTKNNIKDDPLILFKDKEGVKFIDNEDNTYILVFKKNADYDKIIKNLSNDTINCEVIGDKYIYDDINYIYCSELKILND